MAGSSKMPSQYKNIRPLVIGLGVAGKRHLKAQLQLGIQTGVYSLHINKTDPLRKQTNIIVFDNPQDAIDWCNLVHVCTPDDKHTEYVALALKKGKAVLCEKAFTTSLSDALCLQDLAHKHNSTLIVGQNYRLTPSFAETRKQISEGQLGTITEIETTYFHDRADFERRYSDQYFLHIGGSHAVDLACWTVGKQIVRVQAFSENKLNYSITIEFSSGLKGNIKLDASSPRSISGTDLIVYGEKGKLVSHNKSDKLLFYKYGDKKIKSTPLPNIKTFTIPQEVKIIDDYLSGKTTTHWPLPAVDEALNLIKVLDSIQKASSSGKTERV